MSLSLGINVVLINLLAAELKTVPHEDIAEYKAYVYRTASWVECGTRIPYMVEAYGRIYSLLWILFLKGQLTSD